MHGLEQRLALIEVNVARNVGHEIADDLMLDLYLDTETLGYWDYVAGRVAPPPQFVGEKFLMDAWNNGQISAAAYTDMLDCPCCQDGTGNPCHIHG